MSVTQTIHITDTQPTRAKPIKKDALFSLKSSGSAQPTRAKPTRQETAERPMADRPPNVEKKRNRYRPIERGQHMDEPHVRQKDQVEAERDSIRRKRSTICFFFFSKKTVPRRSSWKIWTEDDWLLLADLIAIRADSARMNVYQIFFFFSSLPLLLASLLSAGLLLFSVIHLHPYPPQFQWRTDFPSTFLVSRVIRR